MGVHYAPYVFNFSVCLKIRKEVEGNYVLSMLRFPALETKGEASVTQHSLLLHGTWTCK